MLVLLLPCAFAQEINIEAHKACAGNPFGMGNTLDVNSSQFTTLIEDIDFFDWITGYQPRAECPVTCGYYADNITHGLCNACSSSLLWDICLLSSDLYAELECHRYTFLVRSLTTCTEFLNCQWSGGACVAQALPPPSSHKPSPLLWLLALVPAVFIGYYLYRRRPATNHELLGYANGKYWPEDHGDV